MRARCVPWQTIIARWSWAWAHAFGQAGPSHRQASRESRPLRIRSAQSSSAPTRGWLANSMTWWPTSRSRHSPLYPAKRRSGRSANEFMPAWPMAACRWSGSFPCRTPSRPSHRSSDGSRSKAKRIGQTAPIAEFMSFTTSHTPGRFTSRSASGCCRSTRNGSKPRPRCPGRQPRRPRSSTAASRSCAH